MKCEYGQGEAVYRVHDRRGCYAVCPTHAVWRRTQCSRVGGHGKDCSAGENNRVHVQRLDTGESADDFLSRNPLPLHWKSIDGCFLAEVTDESPRTSHTEGK